MTACTLDRQDVYALRNFAETLIRAQTWASTRKIWTEESCSNIHNGGPSSPSLYIHVRGASVSEVEWGVDPSTQTLRVSDHHAEKPEIITGDPSATIQATLTAFVLRCADLGKYDAVAYRRQEREKWKAETDELLALDSTEQIAETLRNWWTENSDDDDDDEGPTPSLDEFKDILVPEDAKLFNLLPHVALLSEYPDRFAHRAMAGGEDCSVIKRQHDWTIKYLHEQIGEACGHWLAHATGESQNDFLTSLYGLAREYYGEEE